METVSDIGSAQNSGRFCNTNLTLSGSSFLFCWARASNRLGRADCEPLAELLTAAAAGPPGRAEPGVAAAAGEDAARGVGAPFAVGEGCAAFAAVGDVAAATADADIIRCCACCGDIGVGAAGVALPLLPPPPLAAGTLSGVSAVGRSRTGAAAAAVGEGAPGPAAAAPAGRRLPGLSADCDGRQTHGEGQDDHDPRASGVSVQPQQGRTLTPIHRVQCKHDSKAATQCR